MSVSDGVDILCSRTRPMVPPQTNNRQLKSFSLHNCEDNGHRRLGSSDAGFLCPKVCAGRSSGFLFDFKLRRNDALPWLFGTGDLDSVSANAVWQRVRPFHLLLVLPESVKQQKLATTAASLHTSSSSLSSGQPVATSTQGFLIGFGILIPLALVLPFVIIDRYDIRNVGFRLAWVSAPFTLTLRTLEALFGFVPTIACQSPWDYVLHVGLILQPKVDSNGKYVAVTLWSMLSNVRQYICWLSVYTLLYHVLAPNFEPFRVDNDRDKLFYWDIPRLYNTFIQAYVVNVTLSLSMTGVSTLGSVLSGVQMLDQVTDHPMFLSESVSDFWGRRWNNLIHVGLKQGVYKPVRYLTGNKFLASLVAFVSSGLYHEYVWILLFFPTTAQLADDNDASLECCPSCYCKAWPGKQVLFFGWNGILISLEYALSRTALMRQLSQRLPQWLQSHLIILTALPVGHLFTQDITRAGYFEHLRQAIPLVTLRR